MRKIPISLAIIITLIIGNVSYANNECSDPYKPLGASYSIARSNTNTVQDNHKNSIELKFQLWRKGDEILHIDSDKKLSTQWHKLTNGKARKVSYFDQYQRGIEFEPIRSSAESWLGKYQLVSDELLSKMTVVTTQGYKCERIEHYQLVNANFSLDVWWLPAKNLAQKIIRKEHEYQTTWQLTEIIYAEQAIEKVFANVNSYQTTDYADIGDNESDPFLLKMINLGFIKHDSSGFYDSNGNMLAKPHQH